MPRRVSFALVLAFAVALLAASPAAADQTSYIVFATGDPAGAACAPYQNVPSAFTCDSLRGAVNAANANPGTDLVFLPTSGAYTLSQGQLTVTDDVLIYGQSARATTVQGSGSTRVLSVNGGVSAYLAGLTISGGSIPQGVGGNIVNSGNLTLVHVRLTNGSAAGGGGGIANSGGSLNVINSLIDHNAAPAGDGGGILSLGVVGATSATLALANSTVAFNTASLAGGISSRGNAANVTSLLQVTLARNTSTMNPGGLAIAGDGESAQSYGSLIAANVGDTASNCTGTVSNSGGNLEDGPTASCGFGATVASGLGTQLFDAGGHTDVLTIPSTSLAKRRANPCLGGTDQRDAPRATGAACDSGAFEEGATAPAITPLQVPTPPLPSTPPPPLPVPVPVVTATPSPAPMPTPSFHQTVVVKRVSGRIRVRRPGSKDFVELDATQSVPLGSTVDTKAGVIQLTSLPKENGKPETAKFYDGIFKVTQKGSTTDLALNEALAACKKTQASAAAKKPKTRKLWGDGSGSFRTRGQYSAATVRGTKWLVQDSCAGTLTRVSKGVVSVRDLVKRKTIIVRAGKQYLAKPRK